MNANIQFVRAGSFVQLLVLGLLLSGCASQTRHMMPTPNLYTGDRAPELFTDLPAELQTGKMNLLYVTDRAPEVDESGVLSYGYGRSRSVAFGSAIVDIEPRMSWQELQNASQDQELSKKLSLRLASIVEHGRFQETPPAVVLIDGQLREDPVERQKTLQTEQAFREEIKRRIALAPKAGVLMFVHGYNNDFDDAAFTLAELWHYLGREYVPVLYTWPAGIGGISGYMYDRESSEFTVHHLKNLIRELIAIPEIEQAHMIAHSRGTDVLSSALRELSIATQASGAEVAEKIRNSQIIFAAPDLDMDVVSQRIVAEQLGTGGKNITIYTSKTDKAIGLAETLFKSVKRVGRLGAADLTQRELDHMKHMDGIALIDLQEIDDPRASHSYFHSDPAASSDLVLAVRYGREPGEENGRPLKPTSPNFWQIEPGYPHQEDSDK